MRFHIPSIPHTVTSKKHSACAFTQNIVNFCAMMSRRGHEIIHYGHRNSNIECAELVTVIEPETYDTLYGNVYDIRKNQYTVLSDDSEMYKLIAGNTIYEISKRKQPGDFLLLFGGFWQKRIADAHQDMIVVEPAIGYPSSFCKYKVYPSYACLHSFVQDANLQMNYYHVVIPHYFDVDDFDATQPKEDYFLFVGRLNFDKGITIAIQLTERIGARLKVCGQGDLSSLGYHQIPEHVDFIGYVGVEERKKLMAKAKCLIMPTLYMEPFGCVAIEGMLSGTPILTNDWGGPGENNVHGVTGFKCRTFEQFEWAARNIHLINPKNCREWAEKNFSFDKIGHMYEEYFQSLQGLDWSKQNPLRTNLDHLTKHYPTSSTEYKWCVVVFAHGDIFYAPDSKRVLEDYFKFNGIPYYFVTEKPSFDTKDAHPSWWKLKVHSMFPVYDFIITWDLDLLPRSRDVKVIHEFDMTKLCMVRDSSVPDTENGYSPCKYNGGLIGIPKTFQAFMENIFDRCAPGGFNDGWEQGHLNQAIYECNIQLYELPRKLNGLYSTQYFQDALLQHYTHGDNAKYKISEHHTMYFDVNVDTLVPKHCERSEVGVACDNLWDKDRQPVHAYSIVVAKFNENIEWTKELGGNVIIYDKSVPPLKNIGREAETYLRYIIEHYNNLPEYVIFLQGNPYDTIWSHTSVKDGLKSPETACPFVAPWTEDPINRYPETYYYRDYYFLLFGEHYTETTIRFATGSQWSVPRHCITHRPLDFYKKLHRMISKSGNPSLEDVHARNYDKYSIDAWMLERLWAPIFNIQVPTSREFIVTREIPYNLFQTFKTKEISPALQAFVDTWKEHNPEYAYKFYDDDMCDQFMKEFDVRAWKAYRRIIPGAFKADLWRCCVLYKYGGVYVDIDTVCVGKIDDFLNDTTEFVTPVDLVDSTGNLLYNAFIAAAPGSKILKGCIDTIVHNVENNIIPGEKIYFAGPGVLANCVNEFLGRDKQASLAGHPGWHDHDKIHLLHFEHVNHHVKDEKGLILFQNKERHTELFDAYHDELNRLNITPWFYVKDILRAYTDPMTVYRWDNKVRLGINSDGGYVIADGLEPYDLYISAGVSCEESFTRDFINKYTMNETSSFAFDGTIDKYPHDYTSNISFIRKNISTVNDTHNTNLDNLLSRHKDAFLKMDIEAHEWKWLMHTPYLKNIKQMVIEFHGVWDANWFGNTNSLPPGFTHKCFEKLSETHAIVHVHGNTGGGSVNGLPNVIELTYIRRDEHVLEHNTQNFPVEGLDFPNGPGTSDFSLKPQPFC